MMALGCSKHSIVAKCILLLLIISAVDSFCNVCIRYNLKAIDTDYVFSMSFSSQCNIHKLVLICKCFVFLALFFLSI